MASTDKFHKIKRVFIEGLIKEEVERFEGLSVKVAKHRPRKSNKRLAQLLAEIVEVLDELNENGGDALLCDLVRITTVWGGSRFMRRNPIGLNHPLVPLGRDGNFTRCWRLAEIAFVGKEPASIDRKGNWDD